MESGRGEKTQLNFEVKNTELNIHPICFFTDTSIMFFKLIHMTCSYCILEYFVGLLLTSKIKVYI